MLALGLVVGVAGVLTLDTPAMPGSDGSSRTAAELGPPDQPPPAVRRFEDVDPDAARDLRAAVDPDRLRCEPQGCERWFRAMGDTMQSLWTSATDDRASMVDGTAVVVLDLATGEDVLRVELEEVLGSTSASSAATGVRSWPVEDGVAVIGDRAIAVVDADGTLRWRVDAEEQLQYADTGGDHIHVMQMADGGARMRSYALDDGALLLERDQATVLSAEPLVLVEHDATGPVVTAFTDDLTEQWRRQLPEARGDAYGGVVGEVVVLQHTARGTSDTVAEPDTSKGDADTDGGIDADGTDVDAEVVVLDRHEGRIVAQLPGGSFATLDVDGLTVMLVASPDTHRRLQGSPSATDDEPHRFRLVAVDAGGVHLDVEVDTARTTFDDIQLWRDATGVVLALGDDDPQRIDLATGQLSPAPEIEDGDEYRAQLDERTTLIGWAGTMGLDGVTLERDGRRTQLTGATGWPVIAGDDVLVVGDGSLLLVDPDAGAPITP